MLNKAANQAVYSGLKTQMGCHQISEAGASVTQKNPPLKFKKENQDFFFVNITRLLFMK